MFYLLVTRGPVVPATNDHIMSGRSIYHLDTLNIKIDPLFQILLIEIADISFFLCSNSSSSSSIRRNRSIKHIFIGLDVK